MVVLLQAMKVTRESNKTVTRSIWDGKTWSVACVWELSPQNIIALQTDGWYSVMTDSKIGEEGVSPKPACHRSKQGTWDCVLDREMMIRSEDGWGILLSTRFPCNSLVEIGQRERGREREERRDSLPKHIQLTYSRKSPVSNFFPPQDTPLLRDRERRSTDSIASYRTVLN